MSVRILIILLFHCSFLFAQNEKEHNAFISEEVNEYEWIENQEESVLDLELQPVDLNNTSRSELENSGLFTPDQIENILFYLYVYGEMKSIYELKMVKGFDYNTIQRILPYVSITPLRKEKKDYLNQSLNVSFKGLITKSDGFKNRNDSLKRLNKKYIGDPLYYGLIYNGKFGKHLNWGIALEKDPGELLSVLSDYYSFYFQYQPSGNGLLKQILIGSFKLRFAQGLIMNNTYETGYSSLHTFHSADIISLRKHNSFSESGFLRGVAVTLEKNKFKLLLYGSSNRIDATLQDSFITSIAKSGKHNTIKTLESKGNEHVNSFGVNLNYKINRFDFGISSVTNNFSKPINVRNETLVNRFYFRGRINQTYSFNWAFKNRYINIYGEEAFSNKSYAFNNSILFQPAKELLLSLSHRYYSPQFYSFYGRVFGNGNIRNEEGFYFYASTYGGFGFYISANIDYYRTLWAVSGSDFPKDGFDLRIRLENKKIEKCLFSFLYKRVKREKESEENNQYGYIINSAYRTTYSFRVSYEYSRQFLSQTLIEYSLSENNAKNKGFHISQILSWQSLNSKSKIQSIISVFDAEDGVSFYSPLRHSLYTATGERVSDKGYKLQLNYSYMLNSSLNINLSYSYLHKNSGSSIGSGMERISGDNRQLCSFLIRYKF